MDSLKYTGQVKIKKLYKNEVIKESRWFNTGKEPLFKFIANCICGNFDSNETPMYIRLFNTDENITVSTELTTIPIINSQREMNFDSTSASAELTFLVPGGAIKEGTVKAIGVFSRNNVNNYTPSAVVTLKEGEELEGTTMASGISYIIIWKMTVSNKETE